MAKNELLPFAGGEDANVLPTAQWEALTDILENGFQSGIAASAQVNRVLAQGAVASCVLGQLIVDRLSKDAPLDKDTLYQNLISALQENAKDVCLPLRGGTMTGTIGRSGALANNINDDSNLQLNGGSGWGKGASIELYGKDRTNDGGAFKVRTTDGTNTADFMVMPDGIVKIKGYFLEYVASKGSGYIRYSSGLQICYLGFSIPDGASSVVVTYPVAFLSVPVVSIGSAGSGNAFVRYGDTTATSVTMIRAGANNNSGTFSGNCVVVGKWK